MTTLHPCGLHLTAEETEAVGTIPPAKVIFRRHTVTDLGDVYLDTICAGWGSRADAERAAAFFGTVVLDAEPAVISEPAHRRKS